jgi:hypothetical protein
MTSITASAAEAEEEDFLPEIVDESEAILLGYAPPSSPAEYETLVDEKKEEDDPQRSKQAGAGRAIASLTEEGEDLDVLTKGLSLDVPVQAYRSSTSAVCEEKSMAYEVKTKPKPRPKLVTPPSPSPSIKSRTSSLDYDLSPRSKLRMTSSERSIAVRRGFPEGSGDGTPIRSYSDRELGKHFGSIPIWSEDGSDLYMDDDVVDVEEVMLLQLLHEQKGSQPAPYRCVGGVYTGDLLDNKYHGHGRYVWSNGDIYEGDFHQHRMHGRGTFTASAGWIYVGSFANDRHGRGSFSWPDNNSLCGTIFEGEFNAQGKMHGNGKFTWTDGTVYEGDFHNGQRHGQGRICRPDGRLYDGQWHEDMRHGYGRYVWPDGDVYEGEWVEDQRTGKGIMHWKNGDVYEGSYLHNKRNGHGRHRCLNGDEYEGQWLEDNIHGYGRTRWADGDHYTGFWVDGLKEGAGKYVWPDGHYYEGEWLRNKKHGYGVYRYADGRVYQGYFHHDKMHGEGTFIQSNGASYQGIWQDGIYKASLA